MAYITAVIKILFLTYHAFKRHFNCPSNSNLGDGLKQLLDSLCREKMANSMKAKWKCQGGFESIPHLIEKMPLLILLSTGFLKQCLMAYQTNFQSKPILKFAVLTVDTTHAATLHTVFPISTDDVLHEHLLSDSQKYYVIQVIKHKLKFFYKLIYLSLVYFIVRYIHVTAI